MQRSFRSLAAAVTVTGAMALTPAVWATDVAAEEFSDAQEAEIKEIVRSYILENPEIIAEAILVLRDRQQQQAEAEAKSMLTANADALFNTETDAVLGNPDGDVTLVEFFDYRCGYCKAVFPQVMDAINADGNVRLVMKEMPILGPASTMAAQWSVAAQKLGAYKEFHTALMNFKGNITLDSLRQIATDSGLDAKKVEDVANSEEVGKELAASLSLAQQLGISGTPAFVIGDTLIPGAIGGDQIKALIERARQEG